MLPRTVCTKPPLWVRLARAINRQAAMPRGLFGRLLGVIWPWEHARVNAEVRNRLDLRPGQRVLEIGSGPGEALRKAALQTQGGKVVGVDVSALMVRLATDRNRKAIARGEVEVRLGDGVSLGLEGEAFDRIFSVHCIYFWRDLDGTLAQLAAALKHDGKLVLAFRPEGDDIPARFRDPTYRFPRPGEVEAALQRVGLDLVRSERSSVVPSVLCVTAARR
jgi:SAM-dependent methyltransferase